MTVRHRFSPRIEDVVVDCTGESSPTKQSMRDECNINNIMARYQRTGTVAHLNRFGPMYGFAPAVDFRDALEMIRKGQEMFSELPATVRKRFNNSAHEFLAFVQDQRNLSEMRELGLANAASRPPAGAQTTPAPSSSTPQASPGASTGVVGAGPQGPAPAPSST